MDKQFAYEIGGRAYIQRPLVLGQIRQLMKAIEGVVIPEDISALGLISTLGDRLSRAIAIVLIPDGVKVKDRDLDAMTAEIENEMSPETAIQVIEHFFICNPIASLFEKIGGMAEKIGKAMMKEKTSSSSSSASSPEETSAYEMTSSGTLH